MRSRYSIVLIERDIRFTWLAGEGEIKAYIVPTLAESEGIFITESLAGLTLDRIPEVFEVPDVVEQITETVIDDDILLILAILESTDSL